MERICRSSSIKLRLLLFLLLTSSHNLLNCAVCNLSIEYHVKVGISKKKSKQLL